MGTNVQMVECFNDQVISTFEKPFKSNSGIAVLKGNICPDGAILKPSAASVDLMVHSGKAVVFEDIEDFKNRINSSDLEVDKNSVLILKNVGPKGYPGMPEVGNMGIPKKLLEQGITDMVRISDGRMSGTAFGTILLHVSPESAMGGPFAFIENGDLIELDVPNRTLNLKVSEAEMTRRKELWKPSKQAYERGYVSMYINHVEQAHKGVDLDFLRGGSGSEITKDSH